MGRPLDPDKPRRITQCIEMFKKGTPKAQIEREMGVSRETLNRYIRQVEASELAGSIKSQQTRPPEGFQPHIDIEETRLGTTIREFRGTADRNVLAQLVPTSQMELPWKSGEPSEKNLEIRRFP